MSILKNAIDSIQVGVEDFDSGEEKRLLSSIRNVYAGLLLLYKEKLCRLSPDYDKDLLIRSKILPYCENGEIRFKGKSNHVTSTVDVRGILDRFKSLGIKTDEKVLDDIQKIRNDIEHYYSKQNNKIISEVLVKCFVLINDFVYHELQEDPKQLLGDECWNILIEEREVYDGQKKRCNSSFDNVDWRYQTIEYALSELNCPECGSDLIEATSGFKSYPEVNLICLACSHTFNFDSELETVLSEYMDILEHINYMDGDTNSLRDDCPNCGRPAFVYEEGCCVACGYELRHKTCALCGEGLSVDDQENRGLCSYHAYQRDKDD